jgi:hypothetical protein
MNYGWSIVGDPKKALVALLIVLPADYKEDDRDVLKHPTFEQLHALGLYGIAKAFAELADTEEAKGIDRNDWLALLLDREASLRRNKRLTARLRAAKLCQQAVAALQTCSQAHKQCFDAGTKA